MEQKTAADKAAVNTDKKAEARRHLIFGIVASTIVFGLVVLMFMIDQYSENHVPNAHVQTRDAADR